MISAVLHIDYALIGKLEIKRQGNEILNKDAWVKENRLEEPIKRFEYVYNNFCKHIGRERGTSFDHEFWTVILNIYYGRTYYTGFRYGCIEATIQFGNTTTSKTWLVIGVTLAEYEDYKFLEE